MAFLRFDLPNIFSLKVTEWPVQIKQEVQTERPKGNIHGIIESTWDTEEVAVEEEEETTSRPRDQERPVIGETKQQGTPAYLIGTDEEALLDELLSIDDDDDAAAGALSFTEQRLRPPQLQQHRESEQEKEKEKEKEASDDDLEAWLDSVL